MKNVPYIKLLLIVITSFLFLYILSEDLKCLLTTRNIDPNFITASITIIALLLSIKQARSDKIYSKNIKLVEILEEKGVLIIGKLLSIKYKSELCIGTTEAIQEAIRSKQIFRDKNMMGEQGHIQSNEEAVVASISVYFPEVTEKYNELITLLRESFNPTINLLSNYEENIDIIKNGTPLKNNAIDNIEKTIQELKTIDENISKLVLEINNQIIEKINKYKKETSRGLKVDL